MRVLFCNIAWMKYYKGNFGPAIDEPIGGGSYVKDTKDGSEKYNFDTVEMHFANHEFTDGVYCLGFVETKALGDKSNQLHIEKIDGCEACSNDESVEDVLVIYCATHPAHKFTTIVGWYSHATLYRDYRSAVFTSGENEEYIQWYNAIAKTENCVLLPTKERSHKTVWGVPRKQTGASYGFGRSNVWFAQNPEKNPLLTEFLHRVTKQIEEYDGENWLDQYPEH